MRTHCAVSKLLTVLIVMSMAFSSGLLGSGCAVHDLGFSGIVFFGQVKAIGRPDAKGGVASCNVS